MSTMRKALKVLSLLAVVGGIDLLITLIVLNTSGDQAPDLLHSIVMGFVVLFAFLLGAQGISAANVPARARGLLPVALVGLLVNAADVVLAILGGTAVVSVVINALIIVGISYCASAVAKEALR